MGKGLNWEKRNNYERAARSGAEAVMPVDFQPVSAKEIDAARTPRGGWTRAQLAEWGVPWPPPKGWRQALIAGSIIVGGKKSLKGKA